MSTTQTLILGAIAGLTIFVGLPLGRLPSTSPTLRASLTALSTGILVFLFWDVVSHAVAPSSPTSSRTRGRPSPAMRRC